MTTLHAPMTRLSIETAVLGNATNLLNFLGYIIKKVKEARSFREECSKLANMRIFISLSLLENKAALSKVRSAEDFLKCLQKVYLLVTQCTQQWSVRHIGWEVVIGQRVEKLMKELELFQETFNTEVLININTNSSNATSILSTMQSDLTTLKTSVQEASSERDIFLTHIQDLIRNWSPEEKKPDLWINGTPACGVFDGVAAVFEKIVVHLGRLPRCVKIYQQIGDLALVQKFLGVVEIDGEIYAMMQSLSSEKTISNVIDERLFSRLSTVQKLQFAYELSATISSLHESRILVKTMSDWTVFIKEGPEGAFRPLLSDLRNARDIWEISSRQEYDIRYQAPEAKRTGMCSRETDIWSLGIILLQCLTESYPYGLRAMEARDSETRKQVQNKIQLGQAQFDITLTNVSPRLISVLKSCLARDPLVRPTGSSLSQQLFDLLISEASNLTMAPTMRALETEVEDTNASQTRADDQSITALLSGVLSKVQERRAANARHKKDGVRPEQSGPFVSRADAERLLAAASDTKPAIMFAIGSAYLWDAVEGDPVDAISLGKKPLEACCAERALPYLVAADEQGYNGAKEELFHVYKLLATYYHGTMGKKDD